MLNFALSAYLIYKGAKLIVHSLRRVDYSNKTILITGASSGIGEQYALNLSQYPNTKLILLSNELEELKRVKESCKNPQNVSVYYIDLTNLQATQEVCQKIVSSCTSLDILINNAGISFRDLFENTDIKSAVTLFNINFISNIAITKAFIPLLKQSKSAKIIVTSSLSGYVCNSCRTLYVSSKAAVNSFYNSLRVELLQYNIQVTLICPDYVKTKLSMRAITGNGTAFGKVDSQISKGFEPSEVVRIALRGAYNKEDEVWVCGIFRAIGMRLLLCFPGLMRWYERRQLKEQLQTIKKD